ncbi:hypothetical protein M0811_09240 [Anaeramoeba ignava]|uniref:TLDc domain-containing protein n=1 Tax=Anaeramoeba ignava TaxID=1746090 RepID=A0A9Q0RBJ7_ANAIG|nr:hypothetical protein M0811_09240 [Anaeramoeba ignava]
MKKENQKKDKQIQKDSEAINKRNEMILKQEHELKDKQNHLDFLLKENERLKTQIQNQNQNQKQTQIQKQKPIIESIPKKQKIKLLKESTILNEEYLINLQKWIPNQNFFKLCKLGFSTKNDGFNTNDFHQKSDDKGETLVLIKTEKGFVFGGYTSVGFKHFSLSKSVMDYPYQYFSYPDNFSFLFTLKNPYNFPPSKFPLQKKDFPYAIYSCNYSYGSFAFGLSLESSGFVHQGNLKADLLFNSTWNHVYSDFGINYQLPPGFTYGGNKKKNLKDSKTFFSEGGKQEFEIYFK